MANATAPFKTDIAPTGVFDRPPDHFDLQGHNPAEYEYIQAVWQLENGFFISAGRTNVPDPQGFPSSAGFENGNYEVIVTVRSLFDQMVGRAGAFATEYLPDEIVSTTGKGRYFCRADQTGEQVNDLVNFLASIPTPSEDESA